MVLSEGGLRLKASEDISLNILFEDNHMLVVIKPAGILSQADITNAPDMLSILKAYLKNKYKKPGNVYLGLLHRLDRPVSGVMVFAKTSKCASRISAQIRERKVIKKYRALVYGCIEPEVDVLTQRLEKDRINNRAKPSFDHNGKEAVLKYKRQYFTEISIQGQSQVLSCLDVVLVTGRSHQIRFQLSQAGHPIVGDRKYNSNDRFRGNICLESYYLELNHPVSNEKMIFEIPMRDDFPWSMFANESKN